VVQWAKLVATSAGGTGWIPGWDPPIRSYVLHSVAKTTYMPTCCAPTMCLLSVHPLCAHLCCEPTMHLLSVHPMERVK